MDGEKRGRGSFDGWSKSSLKSLLEGCSWQWALQKLGGLRGPATPHSAAGTGMHAAIEEHELCRITGVTPIDLVGLLEIAAREAGKDAETIPSDWQAIHGGIEQAAEWAVGLTSSWYDSPIRQQLLTYTPLAVEPHIETDRTPGGHNLRGYLDWIGRDQNGVLTVVDYKSASNLSRWKKAEGHLLEAAVYLYLVSTSEYWSGDEPIRMEWHVVSRKGDTTILEGPSFDAEIISFVSARVLDAERLVDGRLWAPNPSWSLCSDRWCTFYHGCQVSGTLTPDKISFDPPAGGPSPVLPGPVPGTLQGAIPAPRVPGSTGGTHED